MKKAGGYGQFCPVAMAAEVLCTRWTVLVLREMCAGSTRFNELRRGVPLMSPTLLSKRLKELENCGVIERVKTAESGVFDYRLTAAGRDLQSIVLGLGVWGQRWMEAQSSLKNLDPSLLMWDMRRNLNPTPMPHKRCVVQFMYPELTSKRRYWLVVDCGAVDLCLIDPGFEVDLYIVGELRTMTAIWMGLTTVHAEVKAGRVTLTGDSDLKRSMQAWLGLSPFAKEKKRVAA
ncbi:MAG TPA: helix-turn-helix domain-containing protein [Xanthobacteraceae bacterium]